jgi:two-component system, NtrC family, sensor kinase
MKSQLQLILDHCPNMMLLVRPHDLRITLANQISARLLGYGEDQLRSMAITEIETSLQDAFYWDEVRSGEYSAIEAQQGQYQCADGTLLTVMKSVHPLDGDSGPLLLVQARDIRHEQQIEDTLEQTLSQLKTTLESTGNGILVLDRHGRITNMNRLCSAMWNIPQALLLARDDAAILEFLAGQVQQAGLWRSRLHDVLEQHETEDVFRLIDGRVFECKSRPQHLGERIIGRVYGCTDITQRQLAEEALRQSRDQLEARVQERTADLQRANATLQTEQAHQRDLIDKLREAQNQLLQSEKMASIGVLAAGVAHEINNPVGFVNSNLCSLQRYARDLFRLLDAYHQAHLGAADRQRIDGLKHEIDAEFLREDLDSLLAESLDGLDRVKRIVLDMKEFSRIDSSGRQPVSLETGLDSTINLVWNEIKYKAEVVKDYANMPPVECIPSQLNQVFMNLLINAAHAIEGRGRITVRTGYSDTHAWVEIEDTGKGIAPEHLSRIYDPFFTTKPVGQGTGLGLSLSYGIIQRHGGIIEASSTVGVGTVFRLVLPRGGAAGHGVCLP